MDINYQDLGRLAKICELPPFNSQNFKIIIPKLFAGHEFINRQNPISRISIKNVTFFF